MGLVMKYAGDIAGGRDLLAGKIALGGDILPYTAISKGSGGSKNLRGGILEEHGRVRRAHLCAQVGQFFEACEPHVFQSRRKLTISLLEAKQFFEH